MEKKNLMRYFRLEKHQDLFDKAIRPKSCGGGDEFKFLALKGDFILKISLLDIMSEKYKTRNTGELTKLSSQFHNERTLVSLCEDLGISNLMIPLDSNYVIENEDRKEVIEALLEATNQANNLDICKKIVQKLYKKAEELGILDFDAKSILQIYCQKNGYSIPEYSDPIQIGGGDHNPIYQCTLTILLDKQLILTSDKCNNKSAAKKNVALKACQKLNLYQGDLSQNLIQKTKEEVTLLAKQSLTEEILQFKQLGVFEATMNLTKNTGQSLIDYVNEKFKENPFQMLVLASARLNDISGNIWSASLEYEQNISNNELILLHINLKGKDFFEIGYSESKTKAKKTVAEKFIKNSKFFKWIETNYSEYKI